MPRRDLYGDRSPHELPAYGLSRAAQIVRLSPSTLRLWACGAEGQKPLFVPAQPRPLTLSFSNLIEAFVLASMRRVHGLPMQKVRKALRFVARELGQDRPLIHTSFGTDGIGIFVAQADKLLDVSKEGQVALKGVIEASLTRIEWQRGLAARLYPWVRSGDDLARQPKTIVLDPLLGFGQPVIYGTGIEARIVAERYRAGESVLALADDYHVDVPFIEDAIRCETREAA